MKKLSKKIICLVMAMMMLAPTILQAAEVGTPSFTPSNAQTVKKETEIKVKTDNQEVLQSDFVKVYVNKQFPSIVKYELASGKTMLGNPNLPDVVKIDDVEYKPTVTFTKESEKKANYVLTFDKIDVEMIIAIEITNKADNGETVSEERIISYKVTDIKENGSFTVHTIEMPENSVFTVSSEAEGGTFVGTTNQSDVTKTGDTFVNLSEEKVDNVALKYEYGIIYTDDVAASFRSNATSYNDGNRVIKQSKKVGSEVLTSVWSNKWTYRIPTYTKTFDDTRWDYTDRENYAGGAVYDATKLTFPTLVPEPAKGSTIISQNAQTTIYPNVTVQYDDVITMEKPVIEIVITEDINEDETVDWMDAAIAYRDIRYLPVGYEEIPKFAVQRLIHPHSSLGSYTFLESLDETKKVYLKTDGLDQIVLHKVFNYADWGDFTHYAENMGGYEAFKEFVDVSTEEYKAYVGVHTNFTEVFAKSKNFRPETIEPGNGGYAGFGYWFHQVYTPDKTFEAISQERADRLKGFKESIPNMAFIYSDVYTDTGLLERRLASDYEAAGLAHFVEWPYQSEERTIWSHWAVEKNYSPQNLMAYSSDVVRFINNDIKDRWDNNKNNKVTGERVPSSTRLLMGADTTAWEGWSATETNLKYSEAMRKVFDNNIPTKFMQQSPITRWTRGTDSWVDHIWFENGVEVYFTGETTNDTTRQREIKKDGKVIYIGTARDQSRDSQYLIPWDIDDNGVFEEEGKLYHWNAKGGTTTWEVPNSWSSVASVKVYELTDQGKENEVEVPVTGGKITLTASKEVPYVVYKGTSTPVNAEVDYGEGSFVKDPGFNAGKLDGNWTVESGTASVVKDETSSTTGKQVGYELLMGSGATEVSQKITGLESGKTYAISVMTEVELGKEREATLQVDATTTETYTIKSSKHMEANVMSTKAGTNMLPIRVTFIAPANGEITLRLKAGAGDARVKFDNVRLYRTEVPANPEYAGDNVILYQDFEYVPTGYKSEQYVTKENEYLPTYEGYYPFFMSGSIREPKYIIEQINAPYTQNGADDPWDKNTAIVDEVIEGRNSFKVVGAPVGLFVATSPSTVKFTPGKEYRVTFSYEAQPAADYAIAVGGEVGKIEDYDVLLPTSKPTIYTKTFVATAEDQWVGFSRVAITDSEDPTPLVIDNVLIELVGEGTVPSEVAEEQVYEFENAVLVNGPSGNKAEIKENPNDSGGKHVEIFESVGASLTFNDITVESDGLYTLTFDYGAGYNSRRLVLNVNDGADEYVSFPKTSGWGYPWSQKSVDVQLKAGTNKVVVSVISPNSLTENNFGRVNLDCLRVTQSKANDLQGNVYGRLLAENLLDYNEVSTENITNSEDASEGTRVVIAQDSVAKMNIKGVDYGYGVGGISFNSKGTGNGTIKATADGVEIGTLTIAASSDYSVQHLAFANKLTGYRDIELEFDIKDGNAEISWMQFSDQREAEDAFLENGVRIQLQGGSEGRGYINEFETGVYNPEKASRAVKFTVDADTAQMYDLDIRYAVAEDRTNALTVKVNGQTQPQLDFKSTGGWNTWDTKTIQIQLEKGTNIVSLSTDKDADGNFINTGATNIDWVRFRPSAEEATRDASVLIEAESYDNTFDTTKTVSEDDVFVSGTDGSWINFEKVKFTGDLDLLEIRTSEDSAGKIEIFVGGNSIGEFTIQAGQTISTFEIPAMPNEIKPIRIEFSGENTVKLDSFRFLKRASEVKIEGDKSTLYVNQETTLTATILPENATSKEVIWASEDSSIAVVTQKGLVLGVKAGEVNITATSLDGKATASYKMTVEDPSWINSDTILEAEDAELSGGAKVNSNHGGFSGTGFVDGFYKPNYYAGATFNVEAPEAGKYLVAVRYSCNMSDSTDRNSGIEVNGQRLADRIIFKKTGGWNKWQNVFVEVNLNKGNNTIAIKLDSMTMGDTGDFNLDMIAVKGINSEVVVNKTALAAKIAEVEAMEQGNYTEESWNLLETALTSAKAVKDNETATQIEVDNALALLEAAVNALEEKDKADKGVLIATIANAQALDITVYTTESWSALQTALTAAIEIEAKEDATQSEVDKAVVDLNEAISALEVNPDIVDKALLKAKIAQAEALTEEIYTTESWSVLATALADAKNVEANEEATQEEIDQAIINLQGAIDALVEKPAVEVDKTALKAAIASVEALDENLYTAESWQALQIALNSAKATDDKQDAIQNEVDSALLTLNGAIASLVEKPEVTIDKTLLRAKIAQAEALSEDVYTTESWAVLATALTEGKTVEAKEDATQEEIAQAVTNLTDAINALAKKPTTIVDKSILNQTIAEVVGIEKNNYTDDSWNALQAAIVSGKAVSADPAATQTEVDNAVAVLKAAKDALQEKPSEVVDKTALKAKIDSAAAIEKNNYTDESWNNLQVALTEANDVYQKADATQLQVNDAYNKLNAAVVALQEKPVPVDKTSLNSLIERAQAIPKGNYTDGSWSNLQHEIEEAKKVANKETATQVEVQMAESALQNAISNLATKENSNGGGSNTPTSPADKSALESLIKEANQLKKGNYSSASWTVLQNVIANAENCMNRSDASQAEVNSHIAAINSAIAGLKVIKMQKTDTGNKKAENTAVSSQSQTSSESSASSSEVDSKSESTNTSSQESSSGGNLDNSSSATPASPTTSGNMWMIILGIISLIAIAIVVAIIVSRKKKNHQED